MLQRELEVVNSTGIHARPAAAIVETTNRFRSDIFLVKDGVRANGKSIMNIMLLAAEPGAKVLVEIEGPDEREAMEALAKLFADKFLDDDD